MKCKLLSELNRTSNFYVKNNNLNWLFFISADQFKDKLETLKDVSNVKEQISIVREVKFMIIQTVTVFLLIDAPGANAFLK